MSEKPAAEASPGAAPPGGKSSIIGKIILVVVTLVLVVGAAVGGAILGPQLLNRGQPAAAGAKKAEKPGEGKEEEPAEEEEEPSSKKKEELPEIESLEGLVVDIRAATGELHHLKVAIAVEMRAPVPEEDFKKLVPRGRDAAIEYLRSLDYDDVTSPAHYQAIRQELNARISKAMGRKTVKRILFTDFVVQ